MVGFTNSLQKHVYVDEIGPWNAEKTSSYFNWCILNIHASRNLPPTFLQAVIWYWKFIENNFFIHQKLREFLSYKTITQWCLRKTLRPKLYLRWKNPVLLNITYKRNEILESCLVALFQYDNCLKSSGQLIVYKIASETFARAINESIFAVLSDRLGFRNCTCIPIFRDNKRDTTQNNQFKILGLYSPYAGFVGCSWIDLYSICINRPLQAWLTRCCLVTPYDDIERVHRWFR